VSNLLITLKMAYYDCMHILYIGGNKTANTNTKSFILSRVYK